MEGFVKLYRSLLDWQWFGDTPTRDVFIYCLLRANYKPKIFQGVKVDRGSFITSYPRISRDLGFSIQQARTAIKHLKSTGEITVKTNNKYSEITVVDFDFWQGDNRQVNSQTTQNKQPGNSQSTTRERSQEKRNKKDSGQPNKFNNFCNTSYGDVEDLERKLVQ